MGSLTPDEQDLNRGVRLFAYLVDAANRGDALGISYGDFMAYLHGAASFGEFAGRSYRPSDTGDVLTAAEAVTRRAGGRKKVSRLNTTIDAGMDTFIWSRTSKPPFDRPEAARRGSKYGIPYTRPQWLAVFPHDLRRLVAVEGLDARLMSGPGEIPAQTGGPLPAWPAGGCERAATANSQAANIRYTSLQSVAAARPISPPAGSQWIVEGRHRVSHIPAFFRGRNFSRDSSSNAHCD